MILPKGSRQSDKRQLWELIVLPICISFACLALPAVLFSVISFIPFRGKSGIFCKPDGTVVLPYRQSSQIRSWPEGGRTDPYLNSPDFLACLDVYYLTYRSFRQTRYIAIWDSGLSLSVVLGFGQLTFSAAKAIDFFWDLVVGRCGQFFLAIMVYRVVKKSLFLTMENWYLALPGVTASLTEGIGPGAILNIVACLRKAGRRSRASVKWRAAALIFSCCYVLLFASFASITTGYQAILKPYVRRPDTQSLVPTEELRIPQYVIRDGKSIGVHDDYAIGSADTFRLANSWDTWSASDISLALSADGPIAQYHELSTLLPTAAPAACNLGNWSCEWWLRSVNDGTFYTSCNDAISESPCNTCSFRNPSDTWSKDGPSDGWKNNLTWRGNIWQMNSTLEIVAQSTGSAWASWLGDIHVQSNIREQRNSQLWYALDDQAMSADWIFTNSVCQTLNTYQWGFSSLLLFAFCILTVLFMMVLAFLQAEVYWYGRANRYAGKLNLYHTILALAEEIQLALKANPRSWTEMTGEELTVAVKDARVGIEVDALPQSRRAQRQSARERVSQSLTTELEKEALEDLHARLAREDVHELVESHESDIPSLL